jgi:hypothetical protein
MNIESSGTPAILRKFKRANLEAIEKALGTTTPNLELRSKLAECAGKAKGECLAGEGAEASAVGNQLGRLGAAVAELRDAIAQTDGSARFYIEVCGGGLFELDSRLDAFERVAQAAARAVDEPHGRPPQTWKHVLMCRLAVLEYHFNGERCTFSHRPNRSQTKGSALFLMMKLCSGVAATEYWADNSIIKFIDRAREKTKDSFPDGNFMSR